MTIEADFDTERTMIVEAVRGLLALHWPEGAGRDRAADPVAVASVWRAMHSHGFAAVGTDRASGGLATSVAVMRELGRVNCPVPFMPQLVAAFLLDDEADAAVSALRASKDEAVAVAFGAYDGDPCAGSVHFAQGRLQGAARFVEHVATADRLLVIVQGGIAILSPSAEGLVKTDMPGLAIPSLTDLRFDTVAAQWIALGDARLTDAARIARLLLVARAEGAARRAFDLVLDHVQHREQFGQALARFQAMQHKLADSFIALETCLLLVQRAAKAIDDRTASAPFQTDAAIAFAAAHVRKASFEIQHAFGAVGYAEEHEAPALFRRVHSDLARMGGARRAQAALGADMLVGDPAFPARALGQRAETVRSDIRRWLADNWTARDRADERALPFHLRGRSSDFSCRLGDDGWLAFAWPARFGGGDATPLEQLALVEELTLAGAPISGIVASAWLLAPEIIRHGSLWLQQTILPMIRSGQASFALGYSEPQAGSDLTALKTRAVRDGDDYIITGQKMWGTGTEYATHIILAARTDPDSSRARGISLFVVPADLPGITIVPGRAMYGHTFCVQYYDAVRVPARYMLGTENGGWAVMTGALAAERVQMGGSILKVQRTFEKLCGHLSTTARGDDAEVRAIIGGFAAELEAARQLSLRSVQMLEEGRMPVIEGAMTKIFSGDLTERFAVAAIDLLGTEGLYGEDAPDAPLDGMVEWTLRQSIMLVIGGGAAEVQKDIIAQRGLGLPR